MNCKSLNNKKIWQIGELKQRVIDLLKINFKVCPIYIGDDNIEHIKSEHPHAYARYGADIKDILENPKYVSQHPICNDDSIHYIKIYTQSNDYVKVVVKPTKAGKLFVKSMFIIDKQNIYQYWTRHVFKTY
jgi:hypothetical protein